MFHVATMGLYRLYCRILAENCDPPNTYLTPPLVEFPLKLRDGVWVQKLDDGAVGRKEG